MVVNQSSIEQIVELVLAPPIKREGYARDARDGGDWGSFLWEVRFSAVFSIELVMFMARSTELFTVIESDIYEICQRLMA